MLLKKLWRTMGLYKAQFISMVNMITLGVGVFVGANMEWVSIEKNTMKFFEDTHLADYRLIYEEGFSEEDLDKIKDLNKFLFNFGLKIKVVNEKIYPTEVSKILEEIKGKDEEKVVSTLILRTLKVARYESENKGHFGIASKYYCHFTSPIRRYPDLFIHRIISKYLEDNYVVDEDWIEEYQEKAEQRAASSSDREKVATKVERDSEDLKKAEYMQDKIGEEYDGIVSSVTQFGIFVELENTVEGLIRFENLGDEYFIYDEERKRLIGERTNTTYKIGDKVKIRVISANKMLRQIDFEIVK